MKRSILKFFAVILVVVMMTALFAACGNKNGDSSSPDTSSTGDNSGDSSNNEFGVQTVRVGVMTARSGQNARTGEYYVSAIEMAMEHIKADGFLPDYELEFTYYDDQGTTDGAPAAANLAINDDSHVVIGHYLTTMILISGQFMEDEQIPMIGIVSGPASVQQGWKYFHIGTVTDLDAASTLGEFLVKEKGLKKIFLLTRNDEGGMAGADAIKAALAELDEEYVGEDFFKTDDTDFTAQVLKARDLEADCIIGYGLSAQNGFTVYQNIKTYFTEDIYFCGSTSFAQPAMVENWDADALEGITFPTGYVPNDSDPFVKRFTDDFPSYDPEGMPAADLPARVYDAVWNIAAALNNLGPYDVNAEDFKVKLNDELCVLSRDGVQGHWDYGAFDDGRGLAQASIGEWHSDGTMTKVYP